MKIPVNPLAETEAVRAAWLIESVVGNGWATDNTGKFSYVTPAALTFLGMTLDDLNSTPDDDAFGWKRVVHPEDYDAAAAAWRHSLRTGEPYNVEHRMLRANGVYGWGRSSGRPLRDSDGRITGWYGTVIDSDATSFVGGEFVEAAGAALRNRTVPDGPPSLSDIHPHDRPAAAQAAAYAFWTGVPQIMSYRQRQPDGSYRLTELRAEPGYGVGVNVDAMISTPDERWTASKSLGETTDAVRAAKVIESLYGKAWAFDAAGQFTYVTPVAQTAIGMTIEDLNAPVRGGPFIDGGDTGWSLGVHPADYDHAAAGLRHSLKTGDHWNVEYRMLRTTGQYVWHRIAARPTRDIQGRITGWYGTSIDIDVYKKTEAALRERERELSQLVDMVPSHLWRLGPDGEPVFFNKRMVDFLGLDVADTDRPDMSRLEVLIEAVHPEDAARFRGGLDHCIATGESFILRYRLRRADGAYRWMSSRAEPLRNEGGRIVQWYGLCHDIDDQVRAEEALRNSKRQLEQMIDAVPVNILSFSPSGKMTYASKRYLDNVGMPREHIDDFDALAKDVAHPEDFPEMFNTASDGFATGSAFVNRFRRRQKDGVYRWIEARAQPLRDLDGAVVQWYIASIDIEEEMRAQQALRESERSLRQLIETLPALIYCAAPDGKPIYRSQKLRDFLGFNLEDLDEAGKPRLFGTLDAIIHPDDLAAVKERYDHSLATGTPYAMQHRLRRFDGEYRWVETRTAAMRNAEGAIVQWNGVCFDIEDRVQAQEELRLAQERLARASQAASLAELSASIAHEVNQPLAAVVANSYACQRWLTTEPPNIERAHKTVERITRDANAAADVVSRIRALFKQSVEARKSTTLDSIITGISDLMSEEAARRRVRMDMEVEHNLPAVALDSIQIQQVLINLVHNGMEAMDACANDRVLVVRMHRIAHAVQIEVSDSGPGIEFPDKIFEPFFTTKQSGMGMGLAICRSIVESHGGQLWAQKNEPQGASFIFTLPVETKAS